VLGHNSPKRYVRRLAAYSEHALVRLIICLELVGWLRTLLPRVPPSPLVVDLAMLFLVMGSDALFCSVSVHASFLLAYPSIGAIDETWNWYFGYRG
jgi:hypothetical protein